MWEDFERWVRRAGAARRQAWDEGPSAERREDLRLVRRLMEAAEEDATVLAERADLAGSAGDELQAECLAEDARMWAREAQQWRDRVDRGALGLLSRHRLEHMFELD
jgi:acyl-CoA reductase-like NAD-dependent aldehyde dehydrogenase